jgi:hypothetical protein
LRAAGDGILAIGGNGVDFGLRWHGERDWRRVPAEAPRGLRLSAARTPDVLGAVGDSAVIDACGLGGQALAAAPQLVADWAGALPADALARGPALLGTASGIVEAARVVAAGVGPLVNLAMLDRDGLEGLVGRGFYEVPPALFSTRAPAPVSTETYVRAALALQGYRLDEAQQARVRVQFDAIASIARTVAEYPLGPGDEALPSFRPWAGA